MVQGKKTVKMSQATISLRDKFDKLLSSLDAPPPPPKSSTSIGKFLLVASITVAILFICSVILKRNYARFYKPVPDATDDLMHLMGKKEDVEEVSEEDEEEDSEEDEEEDSEEFDEEVDEEVEEEVEEEVDEEEVESKRDPNFTPIE